MPTNKDDIQDDYYANISQTTENTAGEKKTLKIKPKVVLKKPAESAPQSVKAVSYTHLDVYKRQILRYLVKMKTYDLLHYLIMEVLVFLKSQRKKFIFI